jgi:hypothetical protein
METPSGSREGSLNASRKWGPRIPSGPENRKTCDVETLPSHQLVKIGQVAEPLRQAGTTWQTLPAMLSWNAKGIKYYDHPFTSRAGKLDPGRRA